MKAKPKISLKSGRNPLSINPLSSPADKPIVPGPSPNPMTNLVIADLVLRAGTRVARHAIERGVLGKKYSSGKAKQIVKSRSMVQTLVGTAVARVATGSVPGAIIVGGVLLAKTLYDRHKDRDAAEPDVAAEGEAQIQKQAEKA